MIARNNTQVGNFVPKPFADSEDYKAKIATVTMEAIDAMPRRYRDLVNQFGYVDVYRAWKRGWSPEYIRQRARGETFRL